MKKHITARDAETLITLKLRELNAQILLAEDGTLKATTPQGQTLTIISLLPEEGSKAKFVLPEFQDRPHRFIVCTEQDETGAPVQWVFPEMCFTHRGVARKDRTAEVNLELPGQEPGGCTIRDGLYFLEERWDPIIQFDDFQEYMPPPEHPEFGERWLDMEDILELSWWKEAPAPEKEDFIPITEVPDEAGKLKMRVSDQVVDFINQVPEAEKAELLDGIRSIQEDPYSPDALGIEGTRGNYRLLRPGRD